MADETNQPTTPGGKIPEGDGIPWGSVKVCIAIGIAIVCVIMIVSPLAGAYNTLVDSDLQVQRAQHNIQTDLERRADLLPNLAAEVKGSALFEHDTLVDTIAARSAADANAIKERLKSTSNVNDMESSHQQLNTLVGGIMTLTEQYPTLQSTQQFVDFEAQTTATENEILVDRQTYNAAVMQYQSVCRSFPTFIVAKYYGFDVDKYAMYTPKDQARTETVPAVNMTDVSYHHSAVQDIVNKPITTLDPSAI